MTPNTPQGDLAPLVVAAGRREDGAFERLYDSTSARVFGLVRRTLRDPELSEDVVQEVYLQIWRQAPEYHPRLGTALAWMLTIAHRRAVDRVRLEVNADRRDRRYTADEGAEPGDPADVVVELDAARREQDDLHRCMDELTDRQRDSLTLAYYDGFTYREVAEKLQAPLPTIKSRIRDGLSRLRDCLGVEGDD